MSGEDKSFLLKFSLSKFLDFEIIGSKLHDVSISSPLVKPPHESTRPEVQLMGEKGEIFTRIVHSAQVTYNGKSKRSKDKWK